MNANNYYFTIYMHQIENLKQLEPSHQSLQKIL